MYSNDANHSDNGPCRCGTAGCTSATDWSDAAERSAEIICWLPLLAANDFLEQDDNRPPAA